MKKENPEITVESGLDILSLLNFESMITQVLDQIFGEMISLPLVVSREASLLEGPTISSEIDFVGVIVGHIHLHIPLEFARLVTAQFTSMDPAELDNELIFDTIGEVTNMISGNLKTDLCNTGFECSLKVPRVTHVDTAPVVSEEGSPLLFSHNEIHSFRVVINLKNGVPV